MFKEIRIHSAEVILIKLKTPLFPQQTMTPEPR